MTASSSWVASQREIEARMPDFFIAGHHKCGTTALYETLRFHPQIYMPSLKEPRYFASDLRSQFEPVNSGRLPETLEQYLALFDEAREGQLKGEASPSYLRSRVAASAIAELQPAARIIAILREPVSFLRSLHLQMLQDHVESATDLRQAIAGEERMIDGQRVQRYTDHVRYVEQLRRYHAVFPHEQVLVLIYEDFRADNRATLRRVLRFLRVDDDLAIETVEANPSVRVRSARLHLFLGRLYGGAGPVASPLRRAVKAVTPSKLRRGALQGLRRALVYGEPRRADEELTMELRRRFAPEVVALSEYLDRDLVSQWGYRDVC
jgi:hypothetical protein